MFATTPTSTCKSTAAWASSHIEMERRIQSAPYESAYRACDGLRSEAASALCGGGRLESTNGVARSEASDIRRHRALDHGDLSGSGIRVDDRGARASAGARTER